VKVDDFTERLKLVPGKAELFFYGSGVNIDLVAEWREGPDQPMRRVIASLGGALTTGGPVQ
jgi:hypothetical protein